jgi:hypothetical protein
LIIRIPKSFQDGSSAGLKKGVDSVLIHFKPTKKEIMVYALPLIDANPNQISPHFDEALGGIGIHLDPAAIKTSQ